MYYEESRQRIYDIIGYRPFDRTTAIFRLVTMFNYEFDCCRIYDYRNILFFKFLLFFLEVHFCNL